MKNKFYQVSDKHEDENHCNIVIAKTAREAKIIGSYTDATDNMECWTHLRVKAVRGGMGYWLEDEGGITFTVGGEGFVYTDLESCFVGHWDKFIKELKKQDRYFEENDE